MRTTPTRTKIALAAVLAGVLALPGLAQADRGRDDGPRAAWHGARETRDWGDRDPRRPHRYGHEQPGRYAGEQRGHRRAGPAVVVVERPVYRVERPVYRGYRGYRAHPAPMAVRPRPLSGLRNAVTVILQGAW